MTTPTSLRAWLAWKWCRDLFKVTDNVRQEVCGEQLFQWKHRYIKLIVHVKKSFSKTHLPSASAPRHCLFPSWPKLPLHLSLHRTAATARFWDGSNPAREQEVKECMVFGNNFSPRCIQCHTSFQYNLKPATAWFCFTRAYHRHVLAELGGTCGTSSCKSMAFLLSILTTKTFIQYINTESPV